MNISVHSNVHSRMSQDFTEAFDIKSCFDASGSEAVPETVEVGIRDFTLVHYFFEMILERSGFYVPGGSC